MSSLIQMFAEAREKRFKERAEFLAGIQQERDARMQQRQEQFSVLTNDLAQARHKRLELEQIRQVVSAKTEEERRVEAQVRASEIQDYLREVCETRLILAANDRSLRSQLTKTLAGKVQSQLSQLKRSRLLGATAKVAIRLNIVADRVSAMRSKLAQSSDTRLASAAASKQSRVNEVRLRAATTRLQMRQTKLNRTQQSERDRSQRSDWFAQLANDAQAQLLQTSRDRAAKAEALNQQLSDFYTQLKQSVWSDSDSISVSETETKTELGVADILIDTNLQASSIATAIAETIATPAPEKTVAPTPIATPDPEATAKSESPAPSSAPKLTSTIFRIVSRPRPKTSVSQPVASQPAAEPPIASLIEKIEKSVETVPETPFAQVSSPLNDVAAQLLDEKIASAKPVDPVNKVEQFIHNYVANISAESSLLQVIRDRDTVRNLLAQGANQLQVDPSDILNALLQMAEELASNA